MQPTTIKKWDWKVICRYMLLATLIIAGTPFLVQEYRNEQLWKAAYASDAAKVELLLKQGANPNYNPRGGLMGGTPLFWATAHNDIKTMKLLLKYGAGPNQATATGNVPLAVARTPEVIKLLRDAGATRLDKK